MAIRIVLADDMPELRRLVRAALRAYGDFEVVGEATDGVEAVDLAATHRPDMVLLDIAMPNMDGLEAIPLIRQAVPDCKIVILSGFDSEEMGATARASGADSYLLKGLNPRELVARLSAMDDRKAS